MPDIDRDDQDEALFDEVFSREDERDGAGEHAAAAADTSPGEASPEGVAQGDPPADPDPNGRDTLSREEKGLLTELKSVREAKQEAERARDQAVAQNAALVQQLAGFEEFDEGVTADDLLDDPEGTVATIEQRLSERLENRFLNMSEQNAIRAHGQDAVDAAFDAARAAGVAGRFTQQTDPYEALVEWHKGQQVLSSVGSDLDGFKSRLREELKADPAFLKEVLGGAGNGATPVSPFASSLSGSRSLPPTLADAANASEGASAVPSDEELFRQTFGPRAEG